MKFTKTTIILIILTLVAVLAIKFLVPSPQKAAVDPDLAITQEIDTQEETAPEKPAKSEFVYFDNIKPKAEPQEIEIDTDPYSVYFVKINFNGKTEKSFIDSMLDQSICTVDDKEALTPFITAFCSVCYLNSVNKNCSSFDWKIIDADTGAEIDGSSKEIDGTFGITQNSSSIILGRFKTENYKKLKLVYSFSNPALFPEPSYNIQIIAKDAK